MQSDGKERTGICPWCLKPVEKTWCGRCGRLAWPASEFNLQECHTFSRVRVDHRYQVTKHISGGGFGSVYQAYDSIADEMVALKFMVCRKDKFISRDDARRMLLDECKAVARLKSPHIVVFIDQEFHKKNIPVLVMERLRGRDLSVILGVQRRLTLQQIVDICVPVCEALKVAHGQGYVHMDLKPGNVYIHDDQDGARKVKVLDFGLAKLTAKRVRKRKQKIDECVAGTPGYMSPEQCRGERVTHRSDLFSLGVMLYEMITGALPFNGSTTEEIIRATLEKEPPPFPPDIDVPPALQELVFVLLEKDPIKRLDSAQVVEFTLIDACGGLEPSNSFQLPSGIPPCEHVRPKPPRSFEGVLPDTARMPEPIAPDSDSVTTPETVPSGFSSCGIGASGTSSAGYSIVVPDLPIGLRLWRAAFMIGGRWKLALVTLCSAILVLLLLTGYSLLSANSISDIRQDCGGNSFGVVDVSGLAFGARLIPNTDLVAYKLYDGASFIWVLTEMPGPAEGAQISVTGEVLQMNRLDRECQRENARPDCELVAGAMRMTAECVLLEIAR